MLDDTDRTVAGARAVFDSLFMTAMSVRITMVYRIGIVGGCSA